MGITEFQALKLITSQSRLSSIFQKLLQSCSTIHFAVAWASVGFPEHDALIAVKQKIGRAVVGTHFYQTDPEFIAKFQRDDRVRFVMEHSGVFHPKIYLFENINGQWSCIVGSANFTAGGFGRNQEACILIEETDDPNGTILVNARNSIDRYWKYAIPGAKINLDHYCNMRERFSRPLAHSAGQFGNGKAGRAVEDIEVLNMGWSEYMTAVDADRFHARAKRLDVLRSARELFRQYGTLANMPIKDRQGVAGFLKKAEVPWIWFGNMQGARIFKSVVNRNVTSLSLALDQIPLDGQVNKDDYLAFIDRFVVSFPIENGQHKWHGLSTATRLLAMKRPDYFICLDGPNRAKLLEDFGINMKLHDYEKYWDEIIERVKLSTWWNARRPREIAAGQVWDGRTAMLDAIYYDPDS